MAPLVPRWRLGAPSSPSPGLERRTRRKGRHQPLPELNLATGSLWPHRLPDFQSGAHTSPSFALALRASACGAKGLFIEPGRLRSESQVSICLGGRRAAPRTLLRIVPGSVTLTFRSSAASSGVCTHGLPVRRLRYRTVFGEPITKSIQAGMQDRIRCSL